ncbi:hydrogenase maturation protease [Campylobacterota bacterium]|nr:hydrogenase maturation protease [Campylobacterota bacterium]
MPFASLEIIDGGTLAQLLSPIIAGYDLAVIFDCVSANDGNAGDVYFFDYEDIPNHISWQGSAHEVEMLQTLAMMDIAGDRPTTKIVGIIPQRVEGTTVELTEPIKKGALVMEKTVIKYLQELGFEIDIVKPDLDIQTTANNFGKDFVNDFSI